MPIEKLVTTQYACSGGRYAPLLMLDLGRHEALVPGFIISSGDQRFRKSNT